MLRDPTGQSFNPRPCARGDEVFRDIPDGIREFQSTPLREGRRDSDSEEGAKEVFQSTPLREGRHQHDDGVRFVSDVSIHAPARGATAARRKTGTHEPGFNPRPCARGDS